MKSLKKLFSLFALVLFFSCDENPSPIDNPSQTSIDTKKCSICYEYNDVGTDAAQLDYNLVQTMALNYQYPGGGTSSSNNTRSIWISLDEIKNFIYQIENKTCGCDSKLGIRLYFGAYPDDYRWQNVFQNDLTDLRNKVLSKHSGNNAYAGINTLFMIPTMEFQGKNYDFDPKNYTPSKCSNKIDSFSLTAIHNTVSKANSGIFTNVASGTPITALVAKNHGDACPPPVAGQTCKTEGSHFDY